MKKLLKMQKQVKLQQVVAAMHIFGETKSNSPKANAKNSATKAKLGSKSKKIEIN
jgi:hypothetical protein